MINNYKTTRNQKWKSSNIGDIQKIQTWVPWLFQYACVHGCGALKGLKMAFGTFTATAVENIIEWYSNILEWNSRKTIGLCQMWIQVVLSGNLQWVWPQHHLFCWPNDLKTKMEAFLLPSTGTAWSAIIHYNSNHPRSLWKTTYLKFFISKWKRLSMPNISLNSSENM